jgi:hypothetical protein
MKRTYSGLLIEADPIVKTEFLKNKIRNLDLWKLYRHQIIFDAGNFMVVRNRCELCVFVAPVA